MAVQERNLQAWFGEHWLRGVPRAARSRLGDQLVALRTAADTVRRECPPSSEQSRAITRLRDYWDDLILESWIAALPPETPWEEVYFGPHWLAGFREEERERATAVLSGFQRLAAVCRGTDLMHVRNAWQAAMRALRCFA